MENNTVIKKGKIYRIDRFREDTDGKGISTLIGLSGCPLSCEYCFNKGNKNPAIVHELTVDEVIDIVNKDSAYYYATGGGVVFGGGEPLLQSEFLHEICSGVDSWCVKRIETSLCVPYERVAILIDDIDEWIVDIKSYDKDTYISYTGVDAFNLVQDNLQRLIKEVGAHKVHIRLPHIEGYNDASTVKMSAEEIKNKYGVMPEVFRYVTDMY